MSQDDWVRVPRQPTLKMLEAENSAIPAGKDEDDDPFAWGRSGWKAMLDAAPKPPVPAPQGDGRYFLAQEMIKTDSSLFAVADAIRRGEDFPISSGTAVRAINAAIAAQADSEVKDGGAGGSTDPVGEVVQSKHGNYAEIQWDPAYKATIGDRFYLSSPPEAADEVIYSQNKKRP